MCLNIVENNKDMSQLIVKGKKKHVYICENCKKDDHYRSKCPNN
ncbi:24888_t:CDS:2 [Dentiscutata erythropus]|uniref:24888_t:CDS:1 n=1 Tax=Dentiscutata erythropus TaxID=1348616 RepID=A0A9N9A6M7_9GLOM|nr:24888_t:CDS:2 [Dentiscutata erythropus]